MTEPKRETQCQAFLRFLSDREDSQASPDESAEESLQAFLAEQASSKRRQKSKVVFVAADLPKCKTYRVREGAVEAARAFLADCCTFNGEMTSIDKLHRRWVKWCRERRVDPGRSRQWFSQLLLQADGDVVRKRIRSQSHFNITLTG